MIINQLFGRRGCHHKGLTLKEKRDREEGGRNDLGRLGFVKGKEKLFMGGVFQKRE